MASRPTGDKNDVVKKCSGKQQYIQHVKHVLEKTPTEAYMEFKELHPEIQVKQRKFENLKRFFVKQAKKETRNHACARNTLKQKWFLLLA